MDSATEVAERPAVFRGLGVLLYAGNCRDLLKASLAGKVTLDAWTRRGYPGRDLGAALPQVCSVGGWDAAQPQDWGLSEHCNEGIKIGYVARGTLAVTMDGQKQTLSEGQMYVVRPWQLHSMGDPHVVASQVIWLLLDVGVRRPHESWQWPDWMAWPERDRRRLTELLSKNEQLSHVASREVARSFLDIDRIVAAHDIERDEARLRLVLSMMLLQLKQMLETQAPVLDAALTSSRRTVEIFLRRLTRALDADWTLENMALECGLSRTQFAQHCLALTNMTPVRYLQMIRLDAARSILEEGQHSVTQTAFDCGFSSSQYFATCYKRRFGFTPLETPEKHRLLAG